ncbi:hypothetical protein FHW36_10390 [Chitinophaga polysaccharea]|uniref:Uncharacterized protein n=1 Tax=Chitinophaga polysaccharea TaxID=1293035 RepID=A0A561PT72_9BACT|nr:hypothetical protein [Chitinophaga polysaccharea]TWF41286.1 hypothetical protein FHW36_10390 [Chitinophaga polysaccharea]
MKKIALIVSILSYCFKANARQNIDEHKLLVDSAISIMYTQYLDAIKKQHNDYYLNNLYLLNEQDQSLNYLPSSSKFKLINIYDTRNRKALSKGIYAWKVFTTLRKNQFKIDIVNFYITYKKRIYNFSNGGGSTTVFEYSCNEDKWKLITFNNRGI